MANNRGEWSEAYAAIRIVGDQKLFLADANGQRNANEWMQVLELIRYEAQQRTIKYHYDKKNTIIDICFNGKVSETISLPIGDFVEIADELQDAIRAGKGAAFDVPAELRRRMEKAGFGSIKAKSNNKSDLYLSVMDPRSGMCRNHIGFSVKSVVGHNPTLFNTAKSSAVIYKLTGMTDAHAKIVNSIVDQKGHAKVYDRCQKLLQLNCSPKFVGFPVASRVKEKAFEENLDLLDYRLCHCIERMLWYHFFDGFKETDLPKVVDRLIAKNPLSLTRPDVKYPYMVKAFLYAAYCGMTASTLWDGKSNVNGGFIQVSDSGDVVAYYALESDSFKEYLYRNCYLEFPSTKPSHGNYGTVYKEGEDFYFRLNFQIRYH